MALYPELKTKNDDIGGGDGGRGELCTLQKLLRILFSLPTLVGVFSPGETKFFSLGRACRLQFCTDAKILGKKVSSIFLTSSIVFAENYSYYLSSIPPTKDYS